MELAEALSLVGTVTKEPGQCPFEAFPTLCEPLRRDAFEREPYGAQLDRSEDPPLPPGRGHDALSDRRLPRDRRRKAGRLRSHPRKPPRTGREQVRHGGQAILHLLRIADLVGRAMPTDLEALRRVYGGRDPLRDGHSEDPVKLRECPSDAVVACAALHPGERPLEELDVGGGDDGSGARQQPIPVESHDPAQIHGARLKRSRGELLADGHVLPRGQVAQTHRRVLHDLDDLEEPGVRGDKGIQDGAFLLGESSLVPSSESFDGAPPGRRLVPEGQEANEAVVLPFRNLAPGTGEPGMERRLRLRAGGHGELEDAPLHLADPCRG